MAIMVKKSFLESLKLSFFSKRNLYLICIVTISAVLRLTSLNADPPSDFDPGFICDEGWWVHNSRNFALYGKFILDDFNQSLFLGYPYALLTTFFFRLFGVSFFTMRLTSALFGILIPPILYYIFRKDKEIAYGTSFLAAFSYYIISFSRVALTDITMLFFMILGFYFMFQREHEKMYDFFLAGVFLGLAVATKPYASPVILCWLLLVFIKNKKQSIKKTLFLFAGLAIPLLTGFYFFIFPYFDKFMMLYTRYNDSNAPQGILRGLRNAFEFSYYFKGKTLVPARFISCEPFIFILGFFGVSRSIKSGLFPIKDHVVKWGFLIWLFVSMLFLAPMIYKPDRRFVIFFLPLIYFSIVNFKDDIDEKVPNKLIIKLICILLIAFPVTSYIFPLLVNLSGVEFSLLQDRTKASLLSMFCFIIVFTILWLLRTRILSFSIKKFKIPLLICFTLFSVLNITRYYSNISYSVYDLSKKLPDLLGKSDFKIMGGPVDLLVMENRGFGITPFFAKDLLLLDIKPEKLYNEGRPYPNLETGMNIPFERFHPDYAVEIAKVDQTCYPLWARSPWVWYKKPYYVFPLCPYKGSHRIIIELYKMKD